MSALNGLLDLRKYLAPPRTVMAPLDVHPSDLNQCIVRVVMVSAVLLWSYCSTDSTTLAGALKYVHFSFAVVYLSFSIVMWGWTYAITRHQSDPTALIIATRVLGIFADIGAISVYTATSDANGIVLLPIYLTSIIGYGYRFGVRYLYFTLAVSAVFFAVAANLNQYILQNRVLIVAYYLGMIFVPLYSASLLKKHREVLERLSEVNAARSRFIANMSHELRTPLHAIISVSDVLREDLTEMAPAQTESAQKIMLISDSAQYLLGLVNKILDVAAADAGKLVSKRQERVNLVDISQTALRICEPKAREKGIGFHWYFDARLPVWTQSSGEQVQEILINTVGNAVKYTQNGYVQVRFSLDASAAQHFLNISIIDTGIGISEKILPNIFEPFTLGDDSAERRFPGTGLGLTLTKQYVEMLDGQIFFQSVEDIGTHCRIRLPLIEPRPQASAEASATLARDCLLVSATPPAADELEAFTAAGWRCEVVTTLSASALQQAPARVVFLDVELLKYQGIVFERLAGLAAKRIVVLYGGSATDVVSAAHPQINSAVRRGAVAELRTLRDLETAVFPPAPAPKQKFVDSDATYRVLVADDNPTNLKTARMALESIGHTVVCVASGEDTLTELDRGHFDVALVDMHMPGMSGIEVAQIYQYVNDPNPTPIVILTADVTREARESAVASGAVAFLTKPLRASELRDAVQRHARSARAQSALPERPRRAAAPPPSDALIATHEVDELKALGIHEDELDGMIVEFEQDGVELLKGALGAYQSRDLISLQNIMHSLKGAAGTVGAHVLAAKAFELEHAVWHDGSAEIQARITELEHLLKKSSNLLRGHVRHASVAGELH